MVKRSNSIKNLFRPRRPDPTPSNASPTNSAPSSLHSAPIQTQSTGNGQSLLRRSMSSIRSTGTSLRRRLSRRTSARYDTGSILGPATSPYLPSVHESNENTDNDPANAHHTDQAHGYGNTPGDRPAEQPPPLNTRNNPRPLPPRIDSRRQEWFDNDPTTAEYQPPPAPLTGARHRPARSMANPPPGSRQAPPIHYHSKSISGRPPLPAIRMSDQHGNPLPSKQQGRPEQCRDPNVGVDLSAPQFQDQPSIKFVPKDDWGLGAENPHDHREDDMERVQKVRRQRREDDEGDGGVY